MEPLAEHDNLDIRFARRWPIARWREVTILAAVSGGADSVALVRLLHHAFFANGERDASPRGRIIIAHFDHAWRSDSRTDADFVTGLADHLQLRCEVGGQLATSNREDSKPGSEAKARKARYQFLQQVALDYGARYVMTGHTANDQIETVLHRFVRGTGVRGLAGIPTSRSLLESVSLVRPMLAFRREEIVTYLDSLGQAYRIDETNQDTRWTRNRVRHELLPYLRSEFNPNVDQAILRLASIARDLNEYLEVELTSLLAKAMIPHQDGFALTRSELAPVSDYLRAESVFLAWRMSRLPLQSMGCHEWTILSRMLRDGTPATIMLPSGIQATVDAERMVCQRTERNA